MGMRCVGVCWMEGDEGVLKVVYMRRFPQVSS